MVVLDYRCGSLRSRKLPPTGLDKFFVVLDYL